MKQVKSEWPEGIPLTDATYQRVLDLMKNSGQSVADVLKKIIEVDSEPNHPWANVVTKTKKTTS